MRNEYKIKINYAYRNSWSSSSPFNIFHFMNFSHQTNTFNLILIILLLYIKRIIDVWKENVIWNEGKIFRKPKTKKVRQKKNQKYYLMMNKKIANFSLIYKDAISIDISLKVEEKARRKCKLKGYLVDIVYTKYHNTIHSRARNFNFLTIKIISSTHSTDVSHLSFQQPITPLHHHDVIHFYLFLLFLLYLRSFQF